MNNILIEDWVLYDTIYTGTMSQDSMTGQEFADLQTEAKELRVFGTKKQLRKLSQMYNIDEIFTYNFFEKDAIDTEYWKDICWSDNSKKLPTLKEYNSNFKKTFERYLKLYKLNNNEALILRTN